MGSGGTNRELGGVTVYDMVAVPADGPIPFEPATKHWCGARHRLSIGR